MTEPFRADRITRCVLYRDGATVRLVGDVLRISGLLDTEGLVVTEAAVKRQSSVEAGG